jgi:L-ectoine synthase
MIVRRLEELDPAQHQVVKGETWVSRRLLLAGDGCGFSLHDTKLGAGTRTTMHYKNHVEAVYCVGGKGHIEDLESGEIHPISIGTMYCLNGHERHVLVAEEELHMVCVFNPPVVGPETHGPDGAYPLLTVDDAS